MFRALRHGLRASADGAPHNMVAGVLLVGPYVDKNLPIHARTMVCRRHKALVERGVDVAKT